MNLNQVPNYFIYHPYQNYMFYHPFLYQPNFQQNLFHSTEISKPTNVSQCKENPIQINLASVQKKERECVNKDLTKRKIKKYQSLKKKEKDAQFKQRQQKTNRNLCSNTLKTYFKQLRDRKSQTFQNLNKILQIHSIAITVQDFIKQIDDQFPTNSTYISVQKIKKLCHSDKQQIESLNIGKILRISILRFYRYQILTMFVKYTKLNKKIRNQQIKQGKILIRQLTL